MRSGRKTLIAAFTPLESDAPVIALCLFELSQIPAWLERFLHIASGLFILYLAFEPYNSWGSFVPAIPSIKSGNLKSPGNASLINLPGPGPYLFWSLITRPILLAGWHEGALFGILFLLGFYTVFISSLISIILVFGMIRQAGPVFTSAMIGVSALALICFGLYQLGLGLI